jgi:hypothetical protein
MPTTTLPRSRPTRRARWSAFAVALCSLTLVRSAAAYHTDEDHITDDTAWTLKGDKDFRVGLFKASATIADRFEVGTYVWPWLVLAPNVFAKVRFLSLGPSQWALEAGFFRLDTATFDRSVEEPPVFTVGSLSVVSSLEFGSRHQLSNKLVGTVVRARGAVDDDTLAGTGQAGLTNLQYVLAYEFRVSRSLALVLTGRYQFFQVIDGNTTFTTRPDDYTSIEVVAAARDDSTLNFRNAFSIVPSLAWSWSTFNLRVGVGYGNFNVPGVNFMIEQRTLIPQFDLFWTF